MDLAKSGETILTPLFYSLTTEFIGGGMDTTKHY